MLDAVKRFATKVVLLHLLLMAIVILGVVLGARQVYTSARTQAQEENAQHLAYIAQQTAAAIETQYESIASDMEVLLRDTSAASQPGPGTGGGTPAAGVTSVTTRPARGGRLTAATRTAAERSAARNGRSGGPGLFGGGGVRPVTPETVTNMWTQLQGRVSQLFMVDNHTGEVVLALPAASEASAKELTSQHLEWFRSLKSASMSAFGRSSSSADALGYHLLAIPTRLGRGGGRGGQGGGQGGGPGGGGGRGGQRDFEGTPDPGGRGYGGGAGGMRGGRGPTGGFGPNGPPEGPGGFGGPGRPDMPDSGGRYGGGGGMQGGPPQVQPGDPGYGPVTGSSGDPGPPPTAPDAHTVVVVVPMDKVREEFFDPLNRRGPVVNAMLVNDTGEVLVSISGRWVGANFLRDLDVKTRDAIAGYITQGKAGSYVMDHDVQVGETSMPARIIAFEPVELPSGQKWTVMTMSPLADADALVNRVFGSALWWAIFVSVSIAAILFSTSAFLIRSRVRLERARHEVLTRELQQARNIQLAWLPAEGESIAGLDVAAVNLPASHVSGDFYNWFALEGGKVAVVIGDVTGHGMAAAFLMATTQLLVKMALQRTHDPARCMEIVNKQLCTQSFRGQFVTMLVLIVEPDTGAVEIGTAGHPAPLLLREGALVPLELEPHLVLGVDPAEKYETRGFIAPPGAALLLYTDGVIEAEGDSGEQYGLPRLMHLMGRSGGPQVAPDVRIKAVVDDVRKFRGARDLLDDLTVVGIRIGQPVVTASAPTSAKVLSSGDPTERKAMK